MKLATLVLLSWVGLLQGDELPELNTVISPSERQQFDRATRFQDKLKALRPVLDRHSQMARRMLTEDQPESVEASLMAIRTVVREGVRITHEVTKPKVRRSKAARRMEIRLRKLGEELESMRNASPFELWAVFDAAMEEVNVFRDDLLQGFFDLPSESGSPGLGFAAAASPAFSPSPAAAAQSRIRSSVSGDQFTPTEYEEVQDAQELKLRVQVLLGIAAARLDEMERRMNGLEWDKESSNPLEFYTYAQLVRAYQRSLRSIMINIDEKTRYRLASEKDVNKSLKLLNSQVQNFIPRLKPVENLARDRKDQDLYLE